MTATEHPTMFALGADGLAIGDVDGTREGAAVGDAVGLRLGAPVELTFVHSVAPSIARPATLSMTGAISSMKAAPSCS